MRPNKIKQLWNEGKCPTLGWLSISNGFTAEIMARQGFDALCVDFATRHIGGKRCVAHVAGGFTDRNRSVCSRCME